MATHSSILAQEIPRTEESGGLQSMESQESDATKQVNHHQCKWYYVFNFKFHLFFVVIQENNQYLYIDVAVVGYLFQERFIDFFF